MGKFVLSTRDEKLHTKKKLIRARHRTALLLAESDISSASSVQAPQKVRMGLNLRPGQTVRLEICTFRTEVTPMLSSHSCAIAVALKWQIAVHLKANMKR